MRGRTTQSLLDAHFARQSSTNCLTNCCAVADRSLGLKHGNLLTTAWIALTKV